MAEQQTHACPTCGAACQVVSDPHGEGTNHYEPVAEIPKPEGDRAGTRLELAQTEIERLRATLDTMNVENTNAQRQWNADKLELERLRGQVAAKDEAIRRVLERHQMLRTEMAPGPNTETCTCPSCVMLRAALSPTTAAGEVTENARLRALIERALRSMSADPEADIPWDNIEEVFMSYVDALDMKAHGGAWVDPKEPPEPEDVCICNHDRRFHATVHDRFAGPCEAIGCTCGQFRMEQSDV